MHASALVLLLFFFLSNYGLHIADAICSNGTFALNGAFFSPPLVDRPCPTSRFATCLGHPRSWDSRRRIFLFNQPLRAPRVPPATRARIPRRRRSPASPAFSRQVQYLFATRRLIPPPCTCRVARPRNGVIFTAMLRQCLVFFVFTRLLARVPAVRGRDLCQCLGGAHMPRVVRFIRSLCIVPCRGLSSYSPRVFPFLFLPLCLLLAQPARRRVPRRGLGARTLRGRLGRSRRRVAVPRVRRRHVVPARRRRVPAVPGRFQLRRPRARAGRVRARLLLAPQRVGVLAVRGRHAIVAH
jgi:hypothetical protein